MECKQIELTNTGKKCWVKPDIEVISIQGGNTPLGAESLQTIHYDGVIFTGVYFS